MHTKVLTSLLLTTFIAASLLRSVSTSYQGGGRLSRQAKAGPQQERMQRSSSGGPIRREWPGHLSEDQKDLVAQFLPYLRTEFAGRVQDPEAHYPSWMDFGRRSSEDLEGEA
ncbi:cholecystokinin-like peptide [Podarcis lilfordi]|uniref:Cholecystokinin-like peptide n=2 Tax=Podarcis lilfordi TaxID=74358 RepID=A0AA35L5L8_9SAUR|nr:cholecystokinin-like peptide [Podarcis lilfordi]